MTDLGETVGIRFDIPEELHRQLRLMGVTTRRSLRDIFTSGAIHELSEWMNEQKAPEGEAQEDATGGR